MHGERLRAKLLAGTFAVMFAGPLLAEENPFFGDFKGKLKEGQYDMTIEVEMGPMAGMPPEMSGKQSQKVSHCVTAQDIGRGTLGKDGGGGLSDYCKVLGFKMSGNMATYRVECAGEQTMSMDNQITFVADGYDMNTKMTMNIGGPTVDVTQKTQARYAGPCK
jgi:hypothetical protein